MTDTLMSLIDRFAAGAATPAGWILSSLIALSLLLLIWNALTARRADEAASSDLVEVPPLEPHAAEMQTAREEAPRRQAA